jgi:amino acid transporter
LEERPGDGGQDASAIDRRREDGARPRSEPVLEFEEIVQGRRAGERYVRIPRSAGGLRRREGHLELTRRALEPQSGWGRLVAGVKRALVGEPLATAQLAHERLTKVKALAVLSSDALSSSAYAIDEILLVLMMAGAAALGLTVPVALAIALLLGIVAFSYRQTIRAYPQGGGSYIVTKDNLGMVPSLVAGSALLVGYTLTVAVSVSSGVAAITSALPSFAPYSLQLALTFIVLITVVNLRGVRESGTILAAPTYLFIGSIFLMFGVGAVRLAIGDLASVASPMQPPVESLSIFLVLRAFASGCAALTGTEAISDGVPAFKPPEWQNARATLTWMAAILAVLFLGIAFFAVQLQVVPQEHETVVSQIARATFGETPLYFFLQLATTAILVLAANTSFADFPRLAYFLARDHFLPHQFQFRGDRLAFSTGILALGIVSGAVVIMFDADTHALIPLYAVGVFLAFTLSQASMVRRWWVTREGHWRQSLVVNGVGALTTGAVTVVVGAVNFERGAWMVLALIPVLVLGMRAINAHYVAVADQIALPTLDQPLPELDHPPVIVPVPGVDRAVHRTIAVARSLSPNVIGVHVTDDAEAGERLRQRWERAIPDIPLVLLESPYRSLVGPVLAYINAVQQRYPGKPVVVALSEFVPRHFWEYPLHNQTALRLKAALFFRPNTVVMDVPYHLER